MKRMKDKIIRVVMVPAEGAPYFDLMENTLEAFQKAVGGYIETVRFASNAVLICNEEGKLMKLPQNKTASRIFSMNIVGDCFFVGTKKDEFTDIPAADFMLDTVRKSWSHTEEE